MEKPWQQRLNEAIPFIILIILTIPLAVGYLWIIISTFSKRTYGLVPVDDEGHFGGLTLENWSFLWEDPAIWQVTLNTFIIAAGMTLGVVLISALAGYALARISFPGRRTFLAGTLIGGCLCLVVLVITPLGG
jgi:inositol-phosphate transport system permease protein